MRMAGGIVVMEFFTVLLLCHKCKPHKARSENCRLPQKEYKRLTSLINNFHLNSLRRSFPTIPEDTVRGDRGTRIKSYNESHSRATRRFVNWKMASNKSYVALYTGNSEYCAIVPLFQNIATRFAGNKNSQIGK
jgi:hypothetical protein